MLGSCFRRTFEILEHSRAESVPAQIKANCMCLRAARSTLRTKFLHQPVIATASCKDVPSLSVKNTLEQDTASEELVVQTAKRIDIDLPFDVETLQVCHEYVYASENGRQSLGKLGTFNDGPETVLSLLRSV